mmetsp:Transcript_37999/g.104493  ORF Transcript_37999/g.104493 Transcript_37999/m.104493 type:complete len:1114 (+) Transcript_37999:133-3474(+)
MAAVTAATDMTAVLDGHNAHDALSLLYEFVMATRIEVSLFVAAMLVYFALFRNAMPRPRGKCPQKSASDSESDSGEVAARFRSPAAGKEVLSCWNMMKKCDEMPSVSLSSVVSAFQRLNKDSIFIVQELRGFMNKFSARLDIRVMNDLLDSLGKRSDLGLMQQIVEHFGAVGLAWNERTYEIFLSAHYSLRNFRSIKELVAEMKEAEVTFTTKAQIVVVKMALKTHDMEEARVFFRNLKAAWKMSGPTISSAPQQIVQQLVGLACKEHTLKDLLPDLVGTPLSEDTLSSMLAECTSQRDVSLTQAVEELVLSQQSDMPQRFYAMLLRAYAGEVDERRRIFDDVMRAEVEIQADLALAAIAFCAQSSDIERANQLRRRTSWSQTSVVTAFIRFYVDSEQHEAACDLYETELRRASEEAPSGVLHLYVDARLERALMTSALRCGRANLAKTLLNASPSDVAKHITMIRNRAAEGDLEGAITVFNTLKENVVEMSSVAYNTVIDACVECHNLEAAEAWMQRTKDAGLVDTVSFNTLIKAHLAKGHFEAARGLVEQMKKEGLRPNRVTYNELINATITRNGRKGVWQLIDEMLEAGLRPNQVTCSILSKSLDSNSSQADILRTLDLIRDAEDGMDEVLLSSIIEACVRIAKPELLSSMLKQLQSEGRLNVNSSHAIGSLIKAYGFAGDVDGVWRCWKEMRSRQIRPTSVTLGCMVEAVVSNGDAEGAYDLVRQLNDDDSCKDTLNGVIYCSVLKGFARERNVERALAVYQEMRTKGLSRSIVMYNTLLDACARCGHMHHVPELLADLAETDLKPNVITYSTILKGHCKAGDIHAAFALLDQMKRDTNLKPDEIMYNSLLDGCAQHNLVSEGLRVLDEMQVAGVPPSNFTLSVLVKLMSRARRLDAAFECVAQITAKYHFKPNSHVYTNLIQACVFNKCLNKGFHVLQQMLSEKVKPSSRTYCILINASVGAGLHKQAANLLRGALGLSGAPSFLSGLDAVLSPADNAFVNDMLVAISSCKDATLALIADIRRELPKMHISAALHRCAITSGPVQAAAGGAWAPIADKGANGGHRHMAGTQHYWKGSRGGGGARGDHRDSGAAAGAAPRRTRGHGAWQ